MKAFNGDKKLRNSLNRGIRVDKEDEYLLKLYAWGLDSDGYPKAKINGKHIRLHRVVLKNAVAEEIDHINRNKLDNRKKNLQLSNHSLNALNRKIPITNKSGFKGIYWHKSNKRWIAQIKINDKKIQIGTFKEKNKAIKEYSIMAKKLIELLKESK